MGLRLMTALAAILFLSSAGHAGVAEELTAAINNCAAMTEDGMRHACYDRLPALLKSLPPVAAEPAVAQSKDLPPSGETSSSSGGFSLFGSEPVPANHITAAVESFTYDYGIFIVTLDNGQVWRQVSASGGRVQFSTEKKDKVAIWHGPFGDVLRIEGYPPTYRVRRIK